MEEFERRRAKRKGYQDISTMLQPSKAKSARTTEDEGLLAEDEMDLDSGDVNLNVGDCNANLGADVDLGENSLENDNLAGQGDEAKLGLGNECGAMIMEKLSELSISFNDVCTRLVAVENVLQDLVCRPLGRGLVRAPHTRHVKPRPCNGQARVLCRERGRHKAEAHGTHMIRDAIKVGTA